MREAELHVESKAGSDGARGIGEPSLDELPIGAAAIAAFELAAGELRPGRDVDREDPTMIDVMETVRRFVGGGVWDDSYDEDAIREELGRLGKSTKTSGELYMDAALELWQAERARRYPEPPAEDAA